MGQERNPGDRPGDLPGELRGRDLVGLGGILVVGVVGGLVIGLLVDQAAGTEPLWTLVGIGVGLFLAVVAFVIRVRNALRQ